jgi:hypothetical protein
MAAGGHANLSLVEIRSPRGRGGCPIDINIVKDDKSAVAAQLEMDALEVLCGERSDSPAGRARAGKRDDVHARLGYDVLADIQPAGQDLEKS